MPHPMSMAKVLIVLSQSLLFLCQNKLTEEQAAFTHFQQQEAF